MNSLVTTFIESPYVVLVGWLATVLALIFGFVFFYFQTKKKTIRYFYQNTLLINDNLSRIKDLNVTYQDEKVKQLCVTIMEIYNSGNTMIEESDFYHQKKLKIIPKESDFKILSADLSFQSSETIECAPQAERENIQVPFKYLEPEEKIVIAIYHTGSISAEFNVDGKIKNGGKIVRGGLNPIATRKQLAKYLIPLIVAIVTAIMSVNMFFKSSKDYEHLEELIYCEEELRPIIMAIDGKEGDAVSAIVEYIHILENKIDSLEKEVEEKESQILLLKEKLYSINESINTSPPDQQENMTNDIEQQHEDDNN